MNRRIPTGTYGGGVLRRTVAMMREGPSAGICQENLPNDLSLLCLNGKVVNGRGKGWKEPVT